MIPPRLRPRLIYLGAALATIALGLLVHLKGRALAPVTRDILGDGLWAAMIAWGAGALFPGARLVSRSAAALVVCAAVETSQLIHTPVLDAARASQAGHLVLGSDFDPRDLLAYAIGVGAAALLELAVLARTRSP